MRFLVALWMTCLGNYNDLSIKKRQALKVYIMEEQKLFRQELVNGIKNRNYGAVSINTPKQYQALTFGFSFIVLLIILFIMFGEFSEKHIVNGYLESTKGEARVFPSKNGILVKKYIKHGEEVKKGDKLFLIDTSYESYNKNDKNEILLQLEKKKKSIEKELLYKKKHLENLQQLLVKKYISEAAYHEKQEEINLIKSNKSNIELEIIKYKQEKSYVIYSPIDGIISSVIYETGQYINLARPMVKIIPTNADLMALIFVPVKQSGFLENKSNLIIRFDAYPYARFGTVNAIINEISSSILTDLDEDKPIKVGGPYYKVKAKLDNQFITLYGKNKKIQHGMTISAVIVGAKRKIWQWDLDPIYSFSGGVFL